jgi:hypothetical protein
VVNGSPDVGIAGVAVAGVDRGGGVSASLGGELFGLGERAGELAADVGELGAQFCARGREGGGAVGLALPDRLAAVRR